MTQFQKIEMALICNRISDVALNLVLANYHSEKASAMLRRVPFILNTTEAHIQLISANLGLSPHPMYTPAHNGLHIINLN